MSKEAKILKRMTPEHRMNAGLDIDLPIVVNVPKGLVMPDEEAATEGLRTIFKTLCDEKVKEVILDGGIIEHEPLTPPKKQNEFWRRWHLKLKKKRWKVPFNHDRQDIEPEDCE